MADKKNVDVDSGEIIIEKAKDFWTRNSKVILGTGTVLLLLVAGFYYYRHYVVRPKEEKAWDVMFKAEEYFRTDSFNLALNGDGQNLGFLKVIDRYESTDAGSLARFYAGACYIRLGDNENGAKELEKFSTSSKPLQQKAYKLLGDAYGDLGKNADALENYKKAAHHFEYDKVASAAALYDAAYLADKVMNNQKEAVALYTELKEKFPTQASGLDVDKQLAQLGVYNVN